mmetsp:Transcript_6313/g.25564  ORF Transcript_6313/g.25564 Transcript_6313/m.25564 type:complete len:203 (+) Transcript_6313:1204-1812(+)
MRAPRVRANRDAFPGGEVLPHKRARLGAGETRHARRRRRREVGRHRAELVLLLLALQVLVQVVDLVHLLRLLDLDGHEALHQHRVLGFQLLGFRQSVVPTRQPRLRLCRRVLRGGARGLQSRVQVVPARDGLVAFALDCRECLPREFKLLLRFRETILRHDDLLGTLRVLLVARRELGLELGDACGLVLRRGSPRRSLARRL